MQIDLNAAWNEHRTRVLSDRDEPDELHASDLAGCATAVHQRINLVPQLPNDDGSFANFERGFAYEERVAEALRAYVIPRGLTLSHGEQVTHDGIVGNIDFVIYAEDGASWGGTPQAVVDVTCTAGKNADWGYSHALKTAFYAVAKGCDDFAEFVFQIGFGGVIKDVGAHWFSLDEDYLGQTWRERVAEAVLELQMLAASPSAPAEPRPPWNPKDSEYETWRCNKYCRASRCPLNGRLSAAERARVETPF